MKKFLAWLEKWLPLVWSTLVIFIITGWCIGASIWVIQWIISLLGVM